MIRRTVTNTPLQALVTLNDPVYLEASYHLAKNNRVANDVKKSIVNSYEQATFKKITPNRLEALTELYENSITEFIKNEEASQLFLHFEEQPTAELAALTMVANAIMNLDEFLTKT
jgi:hypothetical protein